MSTLDSNIFSFNSFNSSSSGGGSTNSTNSSSISSSVIGSSGGGSSGGGSTGSSTGRDLLYLIYGSNKIRDAYINRFGEENIENIKKLDDELESAKKIFTGCLNNLKKSEPELLERYVKDLEALLKSNSDTKVSELCNRYEIEKLADILEDTLADTLEDSVTIQYIITFGDIVQNYSKSDKKLEENIIDLRNTFYNQNRSGSYSLDTSRLLDKTREYFQLPKMIQSKRFESGIGYEEYQPWPNNDSDSSIKHEVRICPWKLEIEKRQEIYRFLGEFDMEKFKKLSMTWRLRFFAYVIKLNRIDSDRYRFSNEFREFMGIDDKSIIWRPILDIYDSEREDDSKDSKLNSRLELLKKYVNIALIVLQEAFKNLDSSINFSEDSIRSITVTNFLIIAEMLRLNLFGQTFTYTLKILGLSTRQISHCFNNVTLGQFFWFLEISKSPLKKKNNYVKIYDILRPQVLLFFTLVCEKTPETITEFYRNLGLSQEYFNTLKFMLTNRFISPYDVDTDGKTVFEKACHEIYNEGGRELVEVCIRHGASFEQRNLHGITPLEHACVNDNRSYKQLIKMGAQTSYPGYNLIEWLLTNRDVWVHSIKEEHMRYLNPALIKKLWILMGREGEAPPIPSYLIYKSSNCSKGGNIGCGIYGACDGCEYWLKKTTIF